MEIITLVKANIKRRKGAFIAVMLLTAIIISSSLSILNFLDSKDKALERSFKDIGDPAEVCIVANNYYTPELEDKVRSLDIVKKLEVYDSLQNWYNNKTSNRVGNSNDGNSYFQALGAAYKGSFELKSLCGMLGAILGYPMRALLTDAPAFIVSIICWHVWWGTFAKEAFIRSSPNISRLTSIASETPSV